MISVNMDMYILCIRNIESQKGKCILEKLAGKQSIQECMFQDKGCMQEVEWLHDCCLDNRCLIPEPNLPRRWVATQVGIQRPASWDIGASWVPMINGNGHNSCVVVLVYNQGAVGYKCADSPATPKGALCWPLVCVHRLHWSLECAHGPCRLWLSEVVPMSAYSCAISVLLSRLI